MPGPRGSRSLTRRSHQESSSKPAVRLSSTPPQNQLNTFTHSSISQLGVLYGILSFFACLAPRATFLIFEIIHCPAWLCISGVFGWDGVSIHSWTGRGTDTVGHIGGILGGIGYYIVLEHPPQLLIHYSTRARCHVGFIIIEGVLVYRLSRTGCKRQK